MRSRMGALAERVRANLSLSRRWFGHWRRRYVWLRLAILVLIFAQPVYGVFRPVIRDLVVLAIEGIESAKQGPHFEARARSGAQRPPKLSPPAAKPERSRRGSRDRGRDMPHGDERRSR